jgi:hypothetical protein
MPGAGRVAALEDESRDEAMEYGVVVVSIETELQKVATGQGRLFRKQLDRDLALGRVDDGRRGRLRFEVVDGRHLGVGVAGTDAFRAGFNVASSLASVCGRGSQASDGTVVAWKMTIASSKFWELKLGAAISCLPPAPK